MEYDKPKAEIIDFEKDFVLAEIVPVIPSGSPVESNPYPQGKTR